MLSNLNTFISAAGELFAPVPPLADALASVVPLAMSSLPRTAMRPGMFVRPSPGSSATMPFFQAFVATLSQNDGSNIHCHPGRNTVVVGSVLPELHSPLISPLNTTVLPLCGMTLKVLPAEIRTLRFDETARFPANIMVLPPQTKILSCGAAGSAPNVES